MKIAIELNCKELERVDTPPCPQTHVDLCALEYRKAQLDPVNWQLALATYWAGLISHTLKARN